MHRYALSTTLLLACGEKDTSTTDAASTTTDATTAILTTTLPTTSNASTGTSTTTTSEASTGTSATSEPPPPIHGEWLGTYTTGFGFARFRACGDDDGWALLDDSLPYFNECTQAPLWLRVKGTTTVDGNTTYLTVATILAGPCALGSCDGATPLDACDSFDALCAP